MKVKERKPMGYWTKERCAKEAEKFKYKSEFSRKANGAYISALKNGWIDEICSHMEPKIPESRLNDKIHIYLYLFPDNHFYIGLTGNLDRRDKEHTKGTNEQCRKSAVWKYMQKTGLIPEKTNLEENIPILDKWLEGFWENYFMFLGFTKLNIAPTGSLGSSVRKWTYDKCKEKASLYKTKGEFKKMTEMHITLP